MRQRKEQMETLSQGFVMAPGGIGTLEEFFEILTLKQLGRHQKPIAVLNIRGYFDALEELLEGAVGEGFFGERGPVYVPPVSGTGGCRPVFGQGIGGALMRILVSACLLGSPCKYNGGDNLCPPTSGAGPGPHPRFPSAPSNWGGLSTPRPPAERKDGRVITQSGKDVTECYQKGAAEVARLARLFWV